MSKTIVAALGGSIVFPDQIDWVFLRRFRSFVLQYVKKGKKFVIVVGGGRLSRMYIEAAGKITTVKNGDKDWLGIHATRSNAQLLRTIFRDIADPVVIDRRHKFRKLRFPVTIASGWRPGWSTDYVASVLAKDFGAKEFIVAGKPAYVYDRDPHPKNGKKVDAKPLRELTWAHYRKMVPAKWTPGSHAPVDPIAARFAQKAGLKAIIINGKDLKNFDNLLRGRNFKGSLIK
ncbi:MAG: UMP kinase [Candidatus Brennerbacteria bacterium]|nr:UMP kinase [Candidatus Brennerbacteria bacterium]